MYQTLLVFVTILLAFSLVTQSGVAQEGTDQAAAPFPGAKSEWNGFDRYDFEYDGRTCCVVVPKETAPGKPWIWRARFFGHEPQTDVALLGKGFHLVYIDVAELFGGPKALAHWDAFYDYLTKDHGFAQKAALEGMSRGGLILFNWTAANPDKVACVYADAPVCDIKSWPGGKGIGTGAPDAWQACLKAYGFTEEEALAYDKNPIDNLEPIAKAGIPLLHVCGGVDEAVPVVENTAIVEERYKALGGDITCIIKEDCGHHPHSLEDPTVIVEFVLKHTVNGREGRKDDKDLRDVKDGGGDGVEEVLITDLTGVGPAEAIADVSVKGTWWRRAYTIEGETEERHLLCVEEQDLEDPESCIAPQLRLPLNLEGWYEIWVRTYRHEQGGGIDVRLSDEPYFLHMDPLQVKLVDKKPVPPGENLVDVRYRAADVTGQDLVFQQPFGTYESQTKLCNASLAGVRLVKLSDEQVVRIKADRQRDDVKVIGYDNDGFSYFHRWAVHDPACIARLIEPLREQSVSFFNFELGGLGGLFIPTPYTGMYQMTGHTRHGDYRANAFYRWCFEHDVNIVDVLAERAHEVDVKLFVSLMMERSFSPDETMKAHPEWKVQRGRGRWDYALPEVKDYQVKKIAWIMENHEIDGFIVDFTRYGYYFNEDEPDKFGHMNAFLRRLREATDGVNAKKERKILLCVSFGERSWHLTHWGTGKLEDQGLDVQTWLDEGLFDLMMPEGPTALEYVERAKDSRTKVWPRFVNRVSIKTHKSLPGGESPKELEQGVKWAFDQGAPGIFLFNYEPWTTLGRLGFREELKQRAQTDVVYGLREGPRVEFPQWYPSVAQREGQRGALKPLTIALGPDERVDGDLAVTIRNTFPEPVTASVRWGTPEDAANEPWAILPSDASVEVPAGSEGELRFHLSSDAPGLSAAPPAEVALAAGGQVVLRQRVPLRAVPGLVCSKSEGIPTTDAVEFQPFLETEAKEDGAAQWSVGVAYDEGRLYVFCRCTGIDPSSVDRQPCKRDSREATQSAHVRILLDPSATEQNFYRLAATPGGGMADSRHHYDSFLGHFARKTDWNPEWSTDTKWLSDGFVTTCTISFEALGITPSVGDTWRINVVGFAGAEGSLVAGAWSGGRAQSGENPGSFGTIAFE